MSVRVLYGYFCYPYESLAASPAVPIADGINQFRSSSVGPIDAKEIDVFDYVAVFYTPKHSQSHYTTSVLKCSTHWQWPAM